MRAINSRRANGFVDVVVGAELQAVDAVLLLATRREHEDGDRRLRAQQPQHLESADAGQHDVEHDQVEPGELFAGQLEAPLAIGGGEDAETLPREVVGQGAAQDGVVFDDEDSRPLETTLARAVGGGC